MALKNPVPPPKKDDLDEPADQPGSDASIKKKKNSRRKHRNSHLGCGTCKKRRIKCDENLPACLNCTKGKLHCAYLNLDSSARSALRMAQHNQNIRQDRPPHETDDPQPGPAGPHMPMAVHTLPGQDPQTVVIHSQPPPAPGSMVAANASSPSGSIAPSGHSFAVPYPLIQGSMAVPPQHVIQSPYGPLVSIQPIGGPIQYSQMPVMAGQVPVIYSQVPMVQEGNPPPHPHQTPMQPVVPPISGPGSMQNPTNSRHSIASNHSGSEPIPVISQQRPLNGPPSQPSTSPHSAPDFTPGRRDLQLPVTPIPLSILTPSTSINLGAGATSSHNSPQSLKKEDQVPQKVPVVPRGIAGSYTALPALLSATISISQQLSKSAESTPIIGSIKPVITSSTTVIPGIKSESSGEDSDREVRLPPIKNLNVSEVEKKLETGSNVPKISKLIS